MKDIQIGDTIRFKDMGNVCTGVVVGISEFNSKIQAYKPQEKIYIIETCQYTAGSLNAAYARRIWGFPNIDKEIFTSGFYYTWVDDGQVIEKLALVETLVENINRELNENRG